MSDENRIKTHPIVSFPEGGKIEFSFNGKTIFSKRGEVISSALFANGYRVFGTHHKDNSPQGMFCANGQCAQCLVLADGVPVKACITQVKHGMMVEAIKGLPSLPEDDTPAEMYDIEVLETQVLIVGGGPAGLSAARELGERGVKVIIADDKHKLGGKLILQTHNFFGSEKDCYAGIRGLEIGEILSNSVESFSSVEVWLNSPVVGVFVDGYVGVVKNAVYKLVKPERILVSSGAREKSLAFPGADLPGVYGAGAFQTLVNRDGVKCARSVLIVGGGNVGLIVAYHALQAGIDVVAVVEALPQCGGYKVHLDKIKILGVPVFTSHTIISAEGKDHVEKAVIVQIDENFNPLPGTEKMFNVDTVLIAVGLTPVNEIAVKSKEYGIPTYTAGDACEIAEASSAIFTGKITGRLILKDMGYSVEVPREWEKIAKLLQSKPGKVYDFRLPETERGVYPVIRCVEEIPCDPCITICVKDSIKLAGDDITAIPLFSGECTGCARCVSICPGLAITIVDRRKDDTIVVLPWEMPESIVKVGDKVKTVDFDGHLFGTATVISIKNSPLKNKRKLLHLKVSPEEADYIAGIRIKEPDYGTPGDGIQQHEDDDVIICRCERITKKQIVQHIKTGCSDFNSLKAAFRVGMGACGGKTCTELVMRIFREVGVPLGNVEPSTIRPFTQEVPIKAFLGKAMKNETTL